MTRDDLLALTPAALAALMNMGLVKRAQKELDNGAAPTLDVSDEGTVKATFDDGAVATLAPGKGVRDAPCTCGAQNGCRHRIGAVFAYQRANADSAPPSTTTPTATPEMEWSPGDISDEQLVTSIGAGNVERAKKLRRAGYLADVKRGSFVGDDLPVAHLSTSSVRFLVKGDVGYARCDCTERTNCLHTALAVWAFRAKDKKDRAAAQLTVEVSDAADSASSSSARRGTSYDLPLRTAVELAQLVVVEGVSRLPEAAEVRFALASEALEKAQLTWPLFAVQELGALIERYRRRSALFHPTRLRDVLIELFARTAIGTQAHTNDPALPMRAVLGLDEAIATKLDQTRLIGLGARVSEDGDDKLIEVMFADPSGQGVLVYERVARKTDVALGAAFDGPALGARSSIGGSALNVLASAQLVSNAMTRQANRTVTFSTGGLQKTSVTKGGFSLERMPVDRVIHDVEVYVRQTLEAPPRCVRPRLVGEEVAVVVMATVEHVGWDAASQTVIVSGKDRAGAGIVVERAYSAISPGGPATLAHIAVACREQKQRLIVTGGVRKRGGAIVVSAIAVVADDGALRCLDFEGENAEHRATQASLDAVSYVDNAGPLASVAQAAQSALDDLAITGLRHHSGPARERTASLSRRLAECGLKRAARDLDEVDVRAAAFAMSGSDDDAQAVAVAWAAAATRLSLITERA